MTAADLADTDGKRKNKRSGFKRFKRRDLVRLDETSGPGRFFSKLIRDIESDLSGRSNLSRIESELVRAFAGAACRVQYLNKQLVLGDAAEVHIADFANLASTMLRIGSRLGFERRAKNVTPTLADIIEQDRMESDDAAADAD